MYENRICFIDDVTILHGAVHLHIGGGDLVFVSEENLKEILHAFKKLEESGVPKFEDVMKQCEKEIKEYLESDEFKNNDSR